MGTEFVLCVDDSPAMLKLRKSRLEKYGYSVQTALTVSAAIRFLEQDKAALVLLEYKHEGMDAEAVAYQIKHRFPRVPIVLMSAYSDMSERILWLVDEYVMKSAPLEQLLATIQRVGHLPAIAA